MKESVYGFYPPARDIWTTYRNQPDTYIKESLYRHRSTRFSNTSTVTRQTITGSYITYPQSQCSTSRCEIAHEFGNHKESTAKVINSELQEVTLIRQPSSRHIEENENELQNSKSKTSSHDTAAANKEERRRIDRRSCGRWGNKLAATDYTNFQSPYNHGIMDSVETTPAMKKAISASSQNRSDTELQLTSPQTENAAAVLHTAGIFEKSTSCAVVKIRPSQASALQKQLTTDSTNAQLETRSLGSVMKLTRSESLSQSDKASARNNRQRSMKSAIVREKIHSHDIVAEALQKSGPEDTQGEDTPLNYDELLKKYGWRMEVPGDPCHIKQSCLPKRRPTSVVCTIPVVKPQAPRLNGFDSNETFFYGTLPRQPMSFTVHPDWASEIIVPRRIELLKKRSASAAPTSHGLQSDTYPYCTRDFSFIY